VTRALGRVASSAGVLVVLSLIAFAIQTYLPSDPVRAFFGRNASPELIAAKTRELGLDLPVYQQYLRFLGRAVTGDLGTSLTTQRTVAADLAAYLPATIELLVVAAVMAVVGGVAVGVLSAGHPAAALPIRALSIASASAASFFVALLLVFVFYRQLGWFPHGGRGDGADGPTGLFVVDGLLAVNLPALGDALLHLVLPAFTLALAPGTAIARTLRGSLGATLRSDFVTTARIKGLTEATVLLRHGLRNSLSPVLSMAGLQIGLMLTGAVTVEVVFGWPGLGNYLFQAISKSDFPAVMGVVLVLGVAYVVINAVVDALQVWADPRSRAVR
jgi:peptide/nickel transport system permease protein